MALDPLGLASLPDRKVFDLVIEQIRFQYQSTLTSKLHHLIGPNDVFCIEAYGR